jgi:putative membrane protein
LIAGVSIIHFSEEGWFGAVGIVCLPAIIITGILGIARYRKMSTVISPIRRQANMSAKNDKKEIEP